MYGARYKHKSNLLTPDFGVSVGKPKYCIQIRSLFFQCLVFRVYQFLFLFLCPRLVSVIHSWTPPPPFIKQGVELSKILQKMGAGQIFPIKSEGLVKQEVLLIFILANLFQSYHSPSVWCTCLFCLFIPFLSVFFVFHRKNLILWNLINRYMISTSE